MSKVVQVTGGPSLSFPDDATEDQIGAAMQRDYPTPAQLYNRWSAQLAAPPDNVSLTHPPVVTAPAPDGEPLDVKIGKGFHLAGQSLYSVMADLGTAAFGEAIANVRPDLAQPDAGEPPSNVQAFVRGADQVPAETQLSVLPGALQIPARAAEGLAESVPQMMTVAGLARVGVPPTIAAPAVFGFTPEGFDPKQAGLVALMPFVGRYAGEIGASLSRKLGITSTAAENLFRKAGGVLGVSGLLADFDANQIAALPPEQQHEAMINAAANQLGQLGLGFMGAEEHPLRPAEAAGQLAAEDIAQTVRQSEGNRAQIEQAAAEGPAPIVEPGSRPAAVGVTAADLARVEPKPPVTPRPAIDRVPGSKFRPEVPETPAEERISAVEEIRRSGARTVREIQKLFPKAQLSREQARTWRTAAWGPRDTTEPTSTQAGEAAGAEAADVQTEEEATAPPSSRGGAAPAPVDPTGVARFEAEYSPKQTNKFSTQVGLELSNVQDLQQMLEHRTVSRQIQQRWKKVAEQAQAEGDTAKFSEAVNAMLSESHRAQLAREAIEVATNSGSWQEEQTKLGKRPLDWKANKAVADWLKLNATGAEIVLPDALKPQPKADERPAPRGGGFTASTPVESKKVKGKFDLVDALSGVTTSDDVGYDPKLQPRDRSRVAGQQQVAQIVRNFEPDRLGHSVTTDTGAPIVDEQHQVLSGNGRTMAIRARYLAGHGTEYRDWLIHNAEDFGLAPEDVAAMERPLLVRRVSDYGDLSKEEFARQSNQQQVSGMSEAEKAGADSRMIAGSPRLLELFRPGEDGNILAASNREFLNEFIKATGDQSELLSKEGYNGPAVTRRVRNAVLGAFIGPENRTLLNHLLEEADRLSLKTAGNAFIQAAPALMKFKGTAYDLSRIAAQALRDLVRLRTTGEKLDTFLDYRPLLTEDQRTAESDLLLAVVHQAKSAKTLAEGLQRYATGAGEALQDLQSGGMLGTRPASQRELIERANAKANTVQTEANLAPGQSQRPPGAPGEAESPGSPDAPTPGTPTPGAAAAQAPPVNPNLPPPLGQEQGPNASPGPTVSEFRELNEDYALNPASQATQSADRDLRASQQRRDDGLTAAAQSLARATGPAPQPGRRWFLGLRKIFAAGTIDEDAEVMAGIVRHALGKEYESGRQADFALRPFRKEFDRTPVGRNFKFTPGMVLPRNFEVMRAIDTGEMNGLTPVEAQFATTMRRLFDEAIDLVQAVSPESLRNLVENYFPRLWQDPVRNQDKINALLARRPWEGPKSFLKKRVLQYFTDGLALGLVPVSDNPVDVTLHKLGEMYRFAATRQAIEEAKARGLRKFVYIYEKPPGANWRQVDDPSSTVYAPPTVTVKEAFDAQIRAKTLELLQSLGVPHERLANIGGKRWGYAQSGTGKIVSKFGGPDFILWHEFGHQMDFRYPDLRDFLPTRGNSTVSQELRALADLRYEGQQVPASFKDYVREAEEKMANVFHAYLHAPELFAQKAPNAFAAFREWLERHPEVKNPLNEIKPSLVLGSGETQQFVGGPVLLGRWMMPEGAAQVVDNYLKPGLGRYKWFRSLREIGGLVNGVQLAGFFHGGFVLNDSFYSGIGLALYDVMQGAVKGDISKVIRGAGEVAQIPISPFTSLYRGGKIKSAIENPAAANATYRHLAQLAVDQNLRAGHGNFDPEFGRRWSRALHETLTEPSIGAAWETLWRAPMAAVQTVMKPVMEFMVPRMKLGIYARMAERVITDNPEADELTLRKLLAKAADATEDRLGQVTYDNLFQMRAAKDMSQLAFRAYGWQLTKYRMIFGGTADWARAARAMAAGQAPEVTFRMTYLPAMVMGHALLGASLMYALTGRKPQKLVDYLFPESGLVDAYGQSVRLSIADFVKDVAADLRSFPNPLKMGGDFVRKLGPMWNMAAEMYRNQDFWGTEIFSRKQIGEPELDHFMKNVKEGIQYMGAQVLPFTVRGASRLEQVGAGKLGQLGPMIGITPAPRYATQTAAEARSDEIMRGRLGRDAQSKPQAAKGIAEAQIVRDIRTGKLNSEGQFEAAAKAAGIDPYDARELTKLRERVQWTPLQYKVHKMTVEQSMEIFDLASQQERLSLAPFLADKINTAFAAGRLSPADARRYVTLVMPYYKATAKPAPAAAARPSYSAFAP